MIELKNIEKAYKLSGREEPVLRGVDLNVNEGEFVALMGPSGSGKSTLMNIIGLLDKPSLGEYFMRKKEVSKLSSKELAKLRNKSIGFVFQQFFLLPRLNALQNICLPLSYRNISGADAKQLAMQRLEEVGMKEFWHHKPAELSGGQQQRVAIARALIGNPKLILADEPTGALDSKTGQEVMDLLSRLNKEKNTTIIVVTHDQNIADQCQRVIRLKDGKVVGVENEAI